MNEYFESICKMSCSELFKSLTSKHMTSGRTLFLKDHFIFKEGTLPILLVAHLDTVHKELVKDIIYDKTENIISSFQGIGGDDRCGVYIIDKITKDYDCSVLFTTGEETGGIGADGFIDSINELKQESLNLNFNYIIEFDRMNAKDAVFYDCDNPEFTKFIESTGYFKEAYGTFTDISIIAPELKVAAVNLSCGYYHAHTTNEEVNLSEMERTITEAKKIIQNTNFDKDKFEYIEAKHSYLYDDSKWDLEGNYDDFDDQSEYWIEYTDPKNKSLEYDTQKAYSKAEAIGLFLIDHETLCFNDIEEVIEM